MYKPRHADHQTGPGRSLLLLAAIGLMVGLTALFWAIGKERGGIVESVSSDGGAMVTIARDRSGHYVAEGLINGQPVTFLVDTGATDVAIPQGLARSLGLDFGPRIVLQTAAGPSSGWLTRIDRVQVGSLYRDDVRATITSAPMDTVLLGMSFLKHYRLQQEGERLVIEMNLEQQGSSS